MRDGDTIVALSSGALPSGVAVIRLSGPGTAKSLVELVGALPAERRLELRSISLGGEIVDRGLIAWMPGPRSFTGEDTAELHVHGSAAVVRTILRNLAGRPGFRLAEAGEFSRRAFENGRLDLTEVEGLGDLLAAETEGQRRQAMARYAGALSRQLDVWRESLLSLRAEIEARLDFSDEGDVADELPPRFAVAVRDLLEELALAVRSASAGRIVREGFRVALAGPPNAGKSSLINALSSSEVAIVTDEAGTTRDVREVPLDIDGQLVVLVDMAGLRDTDSKAEAEGVRRARQEITQADLVLWLEAPDVPAPTPPAVPDLWRIATKVDLDPTADLRGVSARTGSGIAELVGALGAEAARRVRGSGLVSRERDVAALQAGAAHLEDALEVLHRPELAAESLRAAALDLDRLLGRMDSEAVLDQLFGAFCIGK